MYVCVCCLYTIRYNKSVKFTTKLFTFRFYFIHAWKNEYSELNTAARNGIQLFIHSSEHYTTNNTITEIFFFLFIDIYFFFCLLSLPFFYYIHVIFPIYLFYFRVCVYEYNIPTTQHKHHHIILNCICGKYFILLFRRVIFICWRLLIKWRNKQK